MIAAKFTGRADTEKLISSLESLNVPQGPDAPAGAVSMNKQDHQARETNYVYKVNGQKDEIINTTPTDKVPGIGDCKAG
jgi:hypothetical protein